MKLLFLLLLFPISLLSQNIELDINFPYIEVQSDTETYEITEIADVVEMNGDIYVLVNHTINDHHLDTAFFEYSIVKYNRTNKQIEIEHNQEMRTSRVFGIYFYDDNTKFRVYGLHGTRVSYIPTYPSHNGSCKVFVADYFANNLEQIDYIKDSDTNNIVSQYPNLNLCYDNNMFYYPRVGSFYDDDYVSLDGTVLNESDFSRKYRFRIDSTRYTDENHKPYYKDEYFTSISETFAIDNNYYMLAIDDRNVQEVYLSKLFKYDFNTDEYKTVIVGDGFHYSRLLYNSDKNLLLTWSTSKGIIKKYNMDLDLVAIDSLVVSEEITRNYRFAETNDEGSYITTGLKDDKPYIGKLNTNKESDWEIEFSRWKDSIFNIIFLKRLGQERYAAIGYRIPYNNMKLLIFDDNPVSVEKEQFLNEEISISPNPASDYIEISLGSHSVNKGLQPLVHGGEIEIYDVLGDKVMSLAMGHAPLSKQRIDVSHLPRGVYYIMFGASIDKFVKY